MNKFFQKSLGWALIAASFIFWGAIVLLPFLDLSGGDIAAATTSLVIAGEITFWLGLLLAGREAWEKIRNFFKKTTKK